MTDYTSEWGAGKEVYGQVVDAFVEAFGPAIPGKYKFYRSPAQWRQFLQMEGAMGRGIIPLIRKYGADTSKWDDGIPVNLPIIGPFTGAQHEFGGNEFIALAAQVAGWDVSDLEQWLLQGRARLTPSLFDPNVPGSYAYKKPEA